MSTRERLKRPTLDRSGPVRSWSTFFGVPGVEAPGNGAAASAAKDAARGRPQDDVNDVVSRSVELGYRVIDEYVRQGERAARRFSDRSYNADAMTKDAQDLTMRMAQYASDFATLWLEFMQLAMGGLGPWPMPPVGGAHPATPSASASPPAPAPPSSAPDAAPPLHVKVAVTSPYATEVSLDLRPQVSARRIVVQALRAASGDEARLSDVALEAAGADEPMTLRIHVPAGQPPGVYNGMIVDEATSVPVGTVSVRIMPA